MVLCKVKQANAKGYILVLCSHEAFEVMTNTNYMFASNVQAQFPEEFSNLYFTCLVLILL